MEFIDSGLHDNLVGYLATYTTTWRVEVELPEKQRWASTTRVGSAYGM